MLEKIIINNINSIKNAEIDFKKGSYKFGEDNIVENIVNPMALYGHNGSGKTSVFLALDSLIKIMNQASAELRPFIVNYFLYNKYQQAKENVRNEDDISGSITLSFSLNNDNYEYFISTSMLAYIRKEYLKFNSKIIFERNKEGSTYGGKFVSFDDNYNLVPMLRSLASSEINNQIIQDAYSYISSFTFLSLPQINKGYFVTSKVFNNIGYADLLVKKAEEIENILKTYKEFPVFKVKKKSELVGINAPISQFVFEIQDGSFKEELPFSLLSAGMRNQAILLSILVSIPENSVVFVDELEQALHPSAIKSFLEVVKKKKIQLVFSSHNTYILQMLRPDQVYFTHWHEGFSKCSRLSKIYPNIREINNIEKMYLSSVFDEAIKNG